MADPVRRIVARPSFSACPTQFLWASWQRCGEPPSPRGPYDGALQYSGRLGVWVLENGSIAFRPVKTGRRDLDGTSDKKA